MACERWLPAEHEQIRAHALGGAGDLDSWKAVADGVFDRERRQRRGQIRLDPTLELFGGAPRRGAVERQDPEDRGVRGGPPSDLQGGGDRLPTRVRLVRRGHHPPDMQGAIHHGTQASGSGVKKR